MKYLILFNLSLILAFIFTRLAAHLFHDYKNYGTKKEKSKTVTAFLRKITKRDIHHIHLGLLIIIVDLILILFFTISNTKIIFLAVGISLIADQIVPLVNKKKNYFKKEQIIYAILLHLLIIILSLFIFGN